MLDFQLFFFICENDPISIQFLGAFWSFCELTLHNQCVVLFNRSNFLGIVEGCALWGVLQFIMSTHGFVVLTSRPFCQSLHLMVSIVWGWAKAFNSWLPFCLLAKCLEFLHSSLIRKVSMSEAHFWFNMPRRTMHRALRVKGLFCC